MDVSRLYIAHCNATAGPILKRIRPRAQGRAFRINKRTSHITLVLKEKED
jgi:large subunit ribosomal protein L22